MISKDLLPRDYLWFVRIHVEVVGEVAAVRSGLRGSAGGREEGP